MHHHNKDVIRSIIGWALIGLLTGLLFLAARYAFRILRSADVNVQAALIAAFATILVSVLSVVLSRHLENRSQLAKEHRDRKIPVYEDLLKILFKVMQGAKAESPLTEAAVRNAMIDFTQRFMVWGSDDAVRAVVNWRQSILAQVANDPSTSAYSVLLFESVIVALRKDLGHRNKDLRQGDFLRLFINDMDSVLARADCPASSIAASSPGGAEHDE
jgi:hypothetical protein